MFVNELTDGTIKIPNPDWERIEALIRRLDGCTRTIVMLGIGTDVPHVAIGGGANGLYVVYVTYDNCRFFSLIESAAPRGIKVEMVVGGQTGDFQREMCVTLDAALRAARVFAETGNLDDKSSWTET